MSPLPPYLQVKQYLMDGLAAGRWPPGAQMPSETELVALLGVSRMTAGRAIKELQAEGLLERRQGKGTFAASHGRVSSTLAIRDLHEEIAAQGGHHVATVHVQRAESACAALAQQLDLPTGATVFHTLIVHQRDGVPVQCEDRYVNPACAPDYLRVDFTATTPTAHLLHVAPLWHAHYTLEASLPTAQEARLLGIAESTPCLVLVRLTTTRSADGKPATPITLARLVHPGDRYCLQGQFEP